MTANLGLLALREVGERECFERESVVHFRGLLPSFKHMVGIECARVG